MEDSDVSTKIDLLEGVGRLKEQLFCQLLRPGALLSTTSLSQPATFLHVLYEGE